MADAKKLKQDLTAIESATSQLAGELDKAYRKYLAILAQSLRRQVISACYGLCTQGYPKRFLKLTFDQREQLQQTLQATVAQSCAQLVDPYRLLQVAHQRRLKESESEDAADASSQGNAENAVILQPRSPAQSGLDLDLTIRAAKVQAEETLEAAELGERELGLQGANRDKDAEAQDGRAQESGQQGDELSAHEPPEPEAQAAEPQDVDLRDVDLRDTDAQGIDTQDTEAQGIDAQSTGAQSTNTQDTDAQSRGAQDIDAQGTNAQDTGAQDTNAIAADIEAGEPADLPKSPSTLLSRQEQLETAIAWVLDDLADDTNDHLREAGILPQDLPEAVLEAVIKAGGAEVVDGPPNVLSLLVRADEEDSEAASVMAIRLQMSELEFNDARLSAKRSQLRGLQGRLRKLSQKYEQYQRDWTTIEAESAWRAAWYEP